MERGNVCEPILRTPSCNVMIEPRRHVILNDRCVSSHRTIMKNGAPSAAKTILFRTFHTINSNL